MKYKYLLLMLIAGVLFVSCDELFEELPDDLNEEINTAEEIRGTLADAYIELLDGGGLGGRLTLNAILMGSLINESSVAQNENEIFNYAVTIFNEDGANPFSDLYRAVQRANLILEKADELVGGDEATNLKGQAYFVRGTAFFYLVRMYAQQYGYTPDNTHPGIPLVLESFSDPQPRASVQAVYDQIINDLQQAESILPTTPGKDANDGNASAWSAKGMLAKVYLQMNNYDQAFNYADDVIENGGFTMEASHVEPVDVNGETVLATTRFREEGTSEGVFLILSTLPTNYAGEIQGKFRSDGENNPPYKLDPTFITQNAFGNDIRANWYMETDGVWELTKYNGRDYNVFPLVHLTELMLIRAESAGRTNKELGKATADLQAILDRAFGEGAFNAPTEAEDIIESALTERTKEMVGEGDELHTFKRLGALGENVTMRGAAWNCDNSILLIPQSELDNNPLINENNPRNKCF